MSAISLRILECLIIWKRFGRNRSWYNPSTFLDRLGKTTSSIIQDKRRPGRDSNRAATEYATTILSYC
jgi:hypothetical protein